MSDPEHEPQPFTPSAIPSGSSAPLREGPGTSIGPYKLLQQLGEGGFGVVFLAEQEQPVVRRVALKIIKLGMDTRQVVARFEQERQALALMDHPNIARVIDAGATQTGRPYFVMELVKGSPIAEYCDKQSLTIDERLELFAQVCGAVQHAHTKGIIHRDLKPSNVLVATQDGRPQVKVIDFGIAKATSAKLTDKTLFTEHQQVIGTLQYMSPEQAEGSLDIDTRTDVYALGVMLYELLTGSTPFDIKTLREEVYSEIQRMIREVEPPSPSTRLGTSQDTLADIAARRRIDPKRLGTLLRGELDWIVMKALEKDRSRRYESASGLALDIARFRRGEAVLAAPVSAGYRLRKFVRRNKPAVLAAGAVATALLIGAVGFAWQARIAQHERDVAQREGRRAQAAEALTQQRADELQQVSEFQAQMLAQVDPSRAGLLLVADVQEKYAAALLQDGLPEIERSERLEHFVSQWKRVNATDTARQLIDRTILQPAVDAIDKQFANQPALDARLRQTLADLYKGLGLFDAALPLQERALATRRSALGAEHADTLDSQNRLEALLLLQGKYDAAEPLARETLEQCRRALGPEHPHTLVACSNRGYVLMLLGRFDEAEPLCRKALDDQRRLLGVEHYDTLSSADNYARLLQSLGKLALAEELHRDTLAKRTHALGPDYQDTLQSLNNLGNLLLVQGRFVEAEACLRDGLERFRRVLGESHAGTVTVISNLGFALQNQGKLAQAEPYVREALDKYRAVLGDLHPDTITAINNLGILLQDLAKLDEAELALQEALELRRKLLGPEHPDTLGSLGNVGRLLMAQERYDEAEPLLREALELKRRVRGEEHPDTLTSINNLGALFEGRGKPAEAEPYFREAMEKCRRVLGPEHPNTLITTINTGAAWVAQKKYAEALELLAPVETTARAAFTGSYARWLAKYSFNLGRARAGVREFAAAEANFLEAQALFVQTRGEAHKETRAGIRALSEFYTEWNAAEPDSSRAAEALEWKTRADSGH